MITSEIVDIPRVRRRWCLELYIALATASTMDTVHNLLKQYLGFFLINTQHCVLIRDRHTVPLGDIVNHHNSQLTLKEKKEVAELLLVEG